MGRPPRYKPKRGWRYKWRRMPDHWRRINIGGQPGDVERAARRILAAVNADEHAMLAITVSSLTGEGTVWDNADFNERHRALGQRLAELDPDDRHKIMTRVTPETAAMLAGKPDEARRLVLGPGADLLRPGETMPSLDLDDPLLKFERDFEDALKGFNLDLGKLGDL